MELVPLLDLSMVALDGLERAVRQKEEEVRALIDQRRNNGNN
jgi:hypothetical protein